MKDKQDEVGCQDDVTTLSNARMYIWRFAIAIKEGKEENLFERST